MAYVMRGAPGDREVEERGDMVRGGTAEMEMLEIQE